MIALRWSKVVYFCISGCAALFACERPDFQLSDTAPVAGLGGTPSSVGGMPADECAIDRSKGPSPIFAGQTLLNASPARSEVYAYVSDAEAQSLRTSGTLFPPLPVNTTPTTPAVLTRLNGLLNTASPAGKSLIQELQQRFKRVRSTWPNPWALRLVNHPGSEHMNPVHIVLRDEAWIGRISDGSLAIMDLKNQIVATDAAALEPHRVAAIYFVASPQTSAGVSFASCEDGFRDFSLANEGMVLSWSLGTTEILERLTGDMQLLTELLAVSRGCSSVDKAGMTFHSYTVCNTWTSFAALTEYSAYGWALATPAELYKPNLQNLVSLVDALKNDRFEPDPFVVRPEPSSAGGSGSGGAGGSGHEGGDGSDTPSVAGAFP
jgi:hypothetical protein